MAGPRTVIYMRTSSLVRLMIYQAICAHEHAENKWPAVGMVNGCGYDGQQIDAICDAHGPC